MSQTDSWTIGRLLQWTADYLKDHGSDSPRLDAEVLLAHARGCQRIELYTCFDEVADGARCGNNFATWSNGARRAHRSPIWSDTANSIPRRSRSRRTC